MSMLDAYRGFCEISAYTYDVLSQVAIKTSGGSSSLNDCTGRQGAHDNKTFCGIHLRGHPMEEVLENNTCEIKYLQIK